MPEDKPSSSPDSDPTNEIWEGDEAALESLLRQVSPIVNRSVRVSLGSSYDQYLLEDVAQDVLFRVLETAIQGRLPLNFTPYVSRIARYRSLDALRWKARYRNRVAEAGIATVLTHEALPYPSAVGFVEDSKVEPNVPSPIAQRLLRSTFPDA